MENRLLAENILYAIAKTHPTIGTLLEHEDSYNNTVDLIKDLLDHDSQLEELQ
jgi:hypothetical protein